MRMPSTGGSLTEVEQERIRLNAPRCTAALLSLLMGRDPHTIAAWAKGNGITFGSMRCGPAITPRNTTNGSAKIERMMALAVRSAA